MSEVDRWKNRRAMAIAAFISGLIYPLGLHTSAAEHYIALAPSFYLFITGVTMAYIGFATADHKWQKPA